MSPHRPIAPGYAAGVSFWIAARTSAALVAVATVPARRSSTSGSPIDSSASAISRAASPKRAEANHDGTNEVDAADNALTNAFYFR